MTHYHGYLYEGFCCIKSRFFLQNQLKPSQLEKVTVLTTRPKHLFFSMSADSEKNAYVFIIEFLHLMKVYRRNQENSDMMYNSWVYTLIAKKNEPLIKVRILVLIEYAKPFQDRTGIITMQKKNIFCGTLIIHWHIGMECGGKLYTIYYRNMDTAALDLRIFVHFLPEDFPGTLRKYLTKSFFWRNPMVGLHDIALF